MKKYIAIILTVIMIFGISACSNAKINETEQTKQEDIQNSTESKDIQDDNTTDETTELTKFDITSDTFITLLNTQLKNSPLKLENIEENETEDGNVIYYTANNNDISIQYEVDKETNDLLMVDLSINDITDENKISDFKEYFIRIRLILDINADAETLFSELHINNFEVSSLFDYNSSNVQYTKVVSVNDGLAFIRMVPSRKEAQDNDISNKLEEKVAEFDMTGDEFISRINELAEGLNQPFVLENFQALEGKKEIDDINQITYFTIAENDVWIYYIINENSNKLHSVLFMINNDKLNEINYLNAYTYFLIASAALDPEPKSDDFEKNLNLSDYSKIKENGLYDTQKARYVKMLTEDNYLLSIEAK